MPRTQLIQAILLLTTPLITNIMAQVPTSLPTQIDTAPATPTSSVSFPLCARSCLADATSSLPCEESDSACLCLHASTVQSSVGQCLTASSACSVTEKASAELYYNNLCLSLGYPTESGAAVATAPIATASGSPSAVQAATPTVTPSTTTTPTTEPSQNNGLPVPAIAGIVAGAVFCVAAIITGFIFMYIQRRSREDAIIVDTEKSSGEDKDRGPQAGRSTRRSAFFALDPSSPSQRGIKQPIVYEKEMQPQDTLKSSAGTLVNGRFAYWTSKEEAEISTSSLISVPRNAHTPIPKSPAVTEFSDVASICSMTASTISSRPPSEMAARSKGGSRVVMSQQFFAPRDESFSQPRPKTAESQRIKLIMQEDGKSDRRLTFNPLGQNPAAHSQRGSMTFNFDLPSPSSTQGFGESFMGGFGGWKEKETR